MLGILSSSIRVATREERWAPETRAAVTPAPLSQTPQDMRARDAGRSSWPWSRARGGV